MIKRIIERIKFQLKQGISPKKLAASIALGVTFGIIPAIWISTPICFSIAHRFKLNHVIIQTINYAIYPLQILLFIPFIRLGETIFGRPHAVINLSFDLPFTKYLSIALMGLAAWIVIGPLLFLLIYLTLSAITKKIPLGATDDRK